MADILKFVTHPNDITIPTPMTSTVEDEVGSLSYHWYKTPTRVYSNVDDLTLDTVFPSSPPEDVPTYELGEDSIRVIKSESSSYGSLYSDDVDYNSGKLHMKYRCDFVRDLSASSYTLTALSFWNYADSTDYPWLSVRYDNLNYGGGVARGFIVEVNGGSFAAVHNIDTSEEITWYEVEFEFNVDTYIYYTIVASNGEEFGGTIDLVAEYYHSAIYPIPSTFKIGTVIQWADEATFSNIEIYEETSREDTGITTESLVLEEGDAGTYYAEIEDDIVLLSSDIGTASEAGAQPGLDFTAIPRFGTNLLSATFTATFTDP